MAFKTKLKKLIHNIGNGVIIGAADHDPAGITTYSIVGATTGFSQLWLVFLSTPLLIVTQSICARIGDVTRKGLTTLIKNRFGKKIAFASTFILILANLGTLGADFAGISAALNLLFPQIKAILFLPIVALVLWWLFVFKNYQTIYKSLLIFSGVFVTYIFAGFLAKPDWGQVLKSTLMPEITFKPSYWMGAVGFLGTTITPFLFFWQVTEERENHPSLIDAQKEVPKIIPGIIFAGVVAFFVILTSAIALNQKQIPIETAADAALALKPLAGDFAFSLFSIGLIAGGLLAIPVIAATTAYTTAELFGWREGLKKKVSQAQSFYTVFTAALVIGMAIALLRISPIKAIFYTQILNGILAPPLLVLVMLISASQKIMGKYKNKLGMTIFGWLAVLVMTFAAIAMFFSFD